MRDKHKRKFTSLASQRVKRFVSKRHLSPNSLSIKATSKTTGKLIVIEGTDGSGKATQVRKLVARLKKEAIPVDKIHFPRYGQPSAYFIEQYLNGRYGSWQEVGPYCASLFYALDRFDVKDKMRIALESGKVLIADRYLPSNLGYQGVKIVNNKERLKFFRWLIRLEYEILGIPQPTKTIILHVPAVIAQKLVDKKRARRYLGGKKRDIHEADLDYLKQVEAVYLQLAKIFPQDFLVVECVKDGRLLSIETIHKEIWRLVKAILSKP